MSDIQKPEGVLYTSHTWMNYLYRDYLVWFFLYYAFCHLLKESYGNSQRVENYD